MWPPQKRMAGVAQLQLVLSPRGGQLCGRTGILMYALPTSSIEPMSGLEGWG